MTAPVADPLPIEPIRGPLDATVRVPGSKSLTNRALLCAALASGTSWLTGALLADDTQAMIECLRSLGADVDVDDDGRGGITVEVVGTGGSLVEGPLDLDVRLSGTASRFLLPVLGIGPGPYRLDGNEPLRARPMAHGVAALRDLGVEVENRGAPGHLPVLVHGRPEATEVAVDGSVSSQFVSGLLLAAPCYRRGLDIRVEGDRVSAPYVQLTIGVVTAFGGAVSPTPAGFWVAPTGYTAVTPYAIEPDATSASYPLAAAAICGGRVRVEGLGRGSAQGDLAFVDVLARMGADVEVGDDYTEVRGDARLEGIDVDLRDTPDVAQTLAAVAVFAHGPTTVRGIGFARGHETDRLVSVVAELGRCGIDATETDDGFVVHPGSPKPATVQTYDDHRMAMSFALLGLRADGIAIADPACVAKTFPGYWDLLDDLRTGRSSGGR
jgi:3-phosphoshikimate 1-carboxyvinyltransferase